VSLHLTAIVSPGLNTSLRFVSSHSLSTLGIVQYKLKPLKTVQTVGQLCSLQIMFLYNVKIYFVIQVDVLNTKIFKSCVRYI